MPQAVTIPSPVISLYMWDNLSGMKPSATKILLDDVDKTTQAQVTPWGVTLDLEALGIQLAEGTHKVYVEYGDNAGNVAGTQFEVFYWNPQPIVDAINARKLALGWPITPFEPTMDRIRFEIEYLAGYFVNTETGEAWTPETLCQYVFNRPTWFPEGETPPLAEQLEVYRNVLDTEQWMSIQLTEIHGGYVASASAGRPSVAGQEEYWWNNYVKTGISEYDQPQNITRPYPSGQLVQGLVVGTLWKDLQNVQYWNEEEFGAGHSYIDGQASEQRAFFQADTSGYIKGRLVLAGSQSFNNGQGGTGIEPGKGPAWLPTAGFADVGVFKAERPGSFENCAFAQEIWNMGSGSRIGGMRFYPWRNYGELEPFQQSIDNIALNPAGYTAFRISAENVKDWIASAPLPDVWPWYESPVKQGGGEVRIVMGPDSQSLQVLAGPTKGGTADGGFPETTNDWIRIVAYRVPFGTGQWIEEDKFPVVVLGDKIEILARCKTQKYQWGVDDPQNLLMSGDESPVVVCEPLRKGTFAITVSNSAGTCSDGLTLNVIEVGPDVDIRLVSGNFVPDDKKQDADYCAVYNEVTHGGVVPVNWNDDNGNWIRDSDESNLQFPDPDLVALRVSLSPEVSGGKLELLSSEDDKPVNERRICTWTDSFKTGQLQMPFEIPLPMQQSLLFWVEGVNGSDVAKDIWIRLKYTTGGGCVLSDEILLTAIDADMDVATRRFETIDDLLDEFGEDTFSKERGAVIRANLDDSNGDGEIDCENNTIDGENDEAQLATAIIRSSDINLMPGGWRALLRMRKDDTAWIRIFGGKSGEPCENPVLGPQFGYVQGDYKYAEIPTSALVAGSSYVLKAEALKFPGYWSGKEFDGALRVWLVYQQSDPRSPGSWIDLCTDVVQVQVEPFVFTSNACQVTAVCANRWIDNEVESALSGTGVAVESLEFQPFDPDLWLQDYAEIGVVRPNFWSRAIVNLLDERDPSWPSDLWKQQGGFYATVNNIGDGGDIECTPPYEGYPFGRVVIGIGTLHEMRRFCALQAIQADDGRRLIELDTQWLEVGHVDAFVNFIDRGDPFTILAASPAVAVDLLFNLLKNGNGDARIRVGTEFEGTWADRSVRDVVVATWGDAGFYKETQLEFGTDAEETVMQVYGEFFQQGEILRIDDEYMRVISPGWTATVTVDRGIFESSPTSHADGAYVCALSDVVRKNIGPWSDGTTEPKGIQQRIDAEIDKILSEPGLQNVRVIRLPVLFQHNPAEGPDEGWAAWTSNVVNCLVCQGPGALRVVMPETFGPTTAGTNVFESYILGQFAGDDFAGMEVRFIDGDVWDLHMKNGEIHCGTNPLRHYQGDVPNWWEAWR